MKIKIGTRKSPLAMAQTHLVISDFEQQFKDIEIQIVPIVSQGDLNKSICLYQLTAGGIFTNEIENALKQGIINAAVHSAKDLSYVISPEFEISAVLKRGSFSDVLVTKNEREFSFGDTFSVGTSSLRRRIFFGNKYKNAVFEDVRGNVDSRLERLVKGEFDGLILAKAGIERLGLWDEGRWNFKCLDDIMPPSPGQGIIAVECLKDSLEAKIIRQLDDHAARLCFETQRQAAIYFGANCQTPFGCIAEIYGENIRLTVGKGDEQGVKILTGQAKINENLILAKELTSRL